MPRRNSTRVQKPRLNGKELLSLDVMRDPRVERPAIQTYVEINWDEILFHLNCDADEKALFHACKLGRTPRNRAGVVLGWTQSRVEAVRRRLDRKLATATSSDIAPAVRDGGSSLRPYFHGSGPSRYTFSMSRLGPVFLEEVNRIRRKNISWSECCPNQSDLEGTTSGVHWKPGRDSVLLPGILLTTTKGAMKLTLEAELETARIQLEQARKRRSDIYELHGKFQARVDAAVKAVSDEMDEAVLKDRDPKAAIMRSLPEAGAKLQESRQLAAAADRVVEKAQSAVEDAQGKIHATAYQTFTNVIAEPAERLHASIYRLAREVQEFDRHVNAALAASPTLSFNLTEILFDAPKNMPTMEDFAPRMAKWGVLSAVSSLIQAESGYQHGSPARRRYETRG